MEPCDDPFHDHWPQAVATTAYRLLVASIVEADGGGAGCLDATFACLGAGRGRSVMIDHDGAPGADRSLLIDRVVASGGRTTSTDGSRTEVWLP